MKELASKILSKVNSDPNNEIVLSLLGLHLSENTKLFDSHIDFDYLDASPFFNTVKEATTYTLNEAAVVELVEALLALNSNVEIETYSIFNFNTVAKEFKSPLSKSLRRLLKESRIKVSVKV